MSTNTNNVENKDGFDEKKRLITLEIATNSAVKVATCSSIAALLGTLYLSKYNQQFSKYMSISAKTSVPVMTFLFFFGLQFELKMHDVISHPRRYGIDDKNQSLEAAKKHSSLSWHHKTMNYFHDHPFYLVGGLGIPFVAGIFHQQLGLKHLTLSQRIMHSRVFGQAGVVTIAMTVMAFKDYMDRNGKFLEPLSN